MPHLNDGEGLNIDIRVDVDHVNGRLGVFNRRSRQERQLLERKRRAEQAVTQRFEALEERWLMATYFVTNTGDSGLGSLRDAINTVNLDSIGPNEIDFNIPGPGVHTIAPASDLPTLTVPIFINGYSQPGSFQNTLDVGDNAVIGIELSGVNNIGSGNGFILQSSSNTISGLAINRFSAAPVSTAPATLLGGSQVLFGNFIGIDPSGTSDAHNVLGLQLTSNWIVGGPTPGARNLFLDGPGDITGRTSGASISTSSFNGSANLIQGNYFGTDRTGNNLLVASSIDINSSDNTIGGVASGAGNVIAGSISLHNYFSSNNLLQGNKVGVKASGNASFGFGIGGISIQSARM